MYRFFLFISYKLPSETVFSVEARPSFHFFSSVFISSGQQRQTIINTSIIIITSTGPLNKFRRRPARTGTGRVDPYEYNNNIIIFVFIICLTHFDCARGQTINYLKRAATAVGWSSRVLRHVLVIIIIILCRLRTVDETRGYDFFFRNFFTIIYFNVL